MVDDVHEETWRAGPGSQIYYPAMQQGPTSAQLVVRTACPLRSRRQCPARTARTEPESTGRRIPAIRTIVDRAVSPRRFFILLVAAFAGLGLYWPRLAFTASFPIR